MSARPALRFILGLLVSLALVAGCGSSNQNVIVGDGSAGSYLSGDDRLYGRVLLDRPAQGATAELTDLAGNPLGYEPVQVDRSGNFRIPVQLEALPEEFRVRVSLGAGSPWNLPIVANVRNDSSGRPVFCNALTSLAALYRERKGGTQDEAVAWVKRVFQIPSHVDIGYGVDESKRSYFRHAALLRFAESEGGVAGYMSTVVDNDGVQGQILVGIAVSVVADLATSAIGKVVGTVAQALGLNTGDQQEIQELADQLSDIQSQVSDLQSQLESDYADLAKLTVAEQLLDTYESLSASLQPVIAEIKAETTDLANAGANASITNAPRIPDPNVQSLLSSIAGFDAQSSLDQLSSVLLGQNQTISLLQVYKELVALQTGLEPVGLTTPANAPAWAPNPALSNGLTFDRYERLVNFYSLQQTLAFNLLVEIANLSQDAATIEEARVGAAQFQVALARQGQSLGYPQASDFYFSNPAAAFQPRAYLPTPSTPSGTVFYSVLQDAVNAYQDVALAETEPVGNGVTIDVYDSDGASNFLFETEHFAAPGVFYETGWRLPSVDELNQLRALALEVNPGNPTAGLASLGFALPADWDNTMWVQIPDAGTVSGTTSTNQQYVGPVPVQGYDFTTGAVFGADIADVFDDLLYASRCYLEVRYQPFNSGTYEQIVAAGFRPVLPPVLNFSEDGTRILADYPIGDTTFENVAPYCVWQSSDPEQLEVEGFGAEAGKITWHPGAGPLRTQTITASWQGMDGATGQAKLLSSTITVPVPSPAPVRTLQSIVIRPNNLILLSPENTLFSATGYYDDHSLADISQQVTWSLELPDGFPYPKLEATITGSIPGLLIFISPLILDTDFTVKATLDGVVGQTPVQLATP